MPSAVVCERVGPYAQGLCLKEVPPLGDPPSGMLLVRVACAGLTFPDLLTVEGKHYGKRAAPFVPASGVAGVVVAVGAGVTGWQIALTEGPETIAPNAQLS